MISFNGLQVLQLDLRVPGIDGCFGGYGKFFRQADHPILRRDNRPFEDINQLADISRPVVIGEFLEHMRRDLLDGFADSGSDLRHEMVHEQGDILPAGAQGRNGDREDIKAIKQVGAEATFGHFLGKVAIGGGDHPRIDFQGGGAANAFKLTLLQHAQQLGLQIQLQLADFVQKNRPPSTSSKRPLRRLSAPDTKKARRRRVAPANSTMNQAKAIQVMPWNVSIDLNAETVWFN